MGDLAINEYAFDTSPRNANGVKLRRDRGGDPWAQAHRKLGRDFYMQDYDGFMAFRAFGKNSEDQLFAELQPDGYANRQKAIRDVGLVSLFDRKATQSLMYENANTISLAFQLQTCRAFALVQPVVPKFFYVVGKGSPWQMFEVNIDSGEISTLPWTLKAEDDWDAYWDAHGLKRTRNGIREFYGMGPLVGKVCNA